MEMILDEKLRGSRREWHLKEKQKAEKEEWYLEQNVV